MSVPIIVLTEMIVFFWYQDRNWSVLEVLKSNANSHKRDDVTIVFETPRRFGKWEICKSFSTRDCFPFIALAGVAREDGAKWTKFGLLSGNIWITWRILDNNGKGHL